MANVDLPIGYRARVPLRCTPYDADASAAAIYTNDLVQTETDGNIIVAAVANLILGASADYSVASTAQTDLGIFDDPFQEFIAQDDASGTSAQTDVGGNADTSVTTGNTTTLISKQEIAISTITTVTANLRIIRLVNTPSNAFGANADFVCQINEHAYRTGTAGI